MGRSGEGKPPNQSSKIKSAADSQKVEKEWRRRRTPLSTSSAGEGRVDARWERPSRRAEAKEEIRR